MTRLRGKDSSQLKKGRAAPTQQCIYLIAGQEVAEVGALVYSG